MTLKIRLFRSSFATTPGARAVYFPKPTCQKPGAPLGLTNHCRAELVNFMRNC